MSHHFIVDQNAEEYRPVITASNVTLAHIRREDNHTQFMFVVVGRDVNNMSSIWR